jgi:D-glycerate 3-kinase
MLGARSVSDETIFESGLPALDTPEHIEFAKYINQKLLNYLPLWEKLEFINVLYVVNYQDSLKWRDQAEEVLRQKGEGMSSEEIKEFVYYFWRSVHPAIQIKNLAEDLEHTDQIVIINDDHSVGDILAPEEVKARYS